MEVFVMENKTPKDIYSSLDKVWPDNDEWYNHTQKCIREFIVKNCQALLSEKSIYLNAGSGGSEYEINGVCYHVDIAENLICKFKNYYVASVENLPFESDKFDVVICVGSVINYCDAISSIKELYRVTKHNGYLIVEFERSNTGELWFTPDYGKITTKQHYEYLGHTHTLWLYSEKMIKNILNEVGFSIVKLERFHGISSLANRYIHNENSAGIYSKFDFIIKPFSYFFAHNVIILCKKL